MSEFVQTRMVGTQPWLPWPLCRWRSWTVPVRAERLAALRIGVALVTLLDVLTSYLPHVHDYYGPESLARHGDRDLFRYFVEAPFWNWTLLRGLGQPANLMLLTVAAFASAFWAIEGVCNRPATGQRTPVFKRIIACLFVAALAGLGFASRLCSGAAEAGDVDLDWLWGPWNANPAALRFFMLALTVALAFMLIGFQTRLATIAVWVLMVSFDNLNPYVENNGDVARAILLLYLVLTPCGAAWSLDRWRERRRTGDDRPAFVHPWPLRLLFLQMILMYFFNGAYKLFGADWREGSSLYYVLASPVLSRVSYAEFPAPIWLTRLASHIVLIWELGFPLWVAMRWTRIPALIIGVLFHIGIWMSMELGFFCGYMLCMYLPFVPWERFEGNRRFSE